MAQRTHPLLTALNETSGLRDAAQASGVSAAVLARADTLVREAEDALVASFCGNCLTDLRTSRERERGRCDRMTEYGDACGVRAARAVWRTQTWLPGAPQRRVIEIRRSRSRSL